MLVAGDAGVGKTRVLNEMAGRAAASGMTVVTGHCVDLGDVGLPYLPFTEILGVLAADERFAGVLAAHPVVERLLGAGTGGVRDVDGRLRLFEGMAGLLADVADVAPLLLVLEDLHWADQSSRDLLRFLLGRGVLRHRLAVLASYRADDLHRRHPLRPLLAELIRLPAVERLELRPLADPDVARLVRALEDRPLPDTTVRRIVERAEGNAFYAEELLAATDSEPAGVPGGLADVLLIRFEQLSDTAQQVLRTAAVAGRRVEHDVLREAVGLPEEELESALREAVGRQLLVAGDDDTYSFRHALAREAVYADLLPGSGRDCTARSRGCSPGAAGPPRALPSAPTTTGRATSSPRPWPHPWRRPTTHSGSVRPPRSSGISKRPLICGRRWVPRPGPRAGASTG